MQKQNPKPKPSEIASQWEATMRYIDRLREAFKAYHDRYPKDMDEALTWAKTHVSKYPEDLGAIVIDSTNTIDLNKIGLRILIVTKDNCKVPHEHQRLCQWVADCLSAIQESGVKDPEQIVPLVKMFCELETTLFKGRDITAMRYAKKLKDLRHDLFKTPVTSACKPTKS